MLLHNANIATFSRDLVFFLIDLAYVASSFVFFPSWLSLCKELSKQAEELELFYGHSYHFCWNNTALLLKA